MRLALGCETLIEEGPDRDENALTGVAKDCVLFTENPVVPGFIKVLLVEGDAKLGLGANVDAGEELD